MDNNDDPKPRKSTFDTMADTRAVAQFRSNPEAALAGESLISAETDQETSCANAVISFATEQPERFLELVQTLPHSIQDIFYQFYLLGRTQDQIADTLSVSQALIWKALGIGLIGICEAIRDGAPGTECQRFSLPEVSSEEKTFKMPPSLGQFVISVDEDLALHFSPMTTNGAVNAN